MFNLTKTVDLVKRRTFRYFKDDNFDIIDALPLEDDKVKLTFISGVELPTNEYASLDIRYKDLFRDHPNLIIVILNKVNHYEKPIEAFRIWQKGKGFST